MLTRFKQFHRPDSASTMLRTHPSRTPTSRLSNQNQNANHLPGASPRTRAVEFLGAGAIPWPGLIAAPLAGHPFRSFLRHCDGTLGRSFKPVTPPAGLRASRTPVFSSCVASRRTPVTIIPALTSPRHPPRCGWKALQYGLPAVNGIRRLSRPNDLPSAPGVRPVWVWPSSPGGSPVSAQWSTLAPAGVHLTLQLPNHHPRVSSGRIVRALEASEWGTPRETRLGIDRLVRGAPAPGLRRQDVWPGQNPRTRDDEP